MWEIWANRLLSKALKSCPKSNKSPNLVTLVVTFFCRKNASLLNEEASQCDQMLE